MGFADGECTLVHGGRGGIYYCAAHSEKKFCPALVVLSSPFAWYYLDEARPYAMQLGASLIIFAALFRLSQNEELYGTQAQRWLAAFFGLGLILLRWEQPFGNDLGWRRMSELAGNFLAGAGLLALARAQWLMCVLACGALGLLAIYYMWTLKVGARVRSAVGATDARNVMFLLYELLGFSGLGPGRLEIRDSGMRALYPFAFLLFAYALAIIQLFSPRRDGIFVSIACPGEHSWD